MIFQRSIAFIYLIAFSSLLSQFSALFSSSGISPINGLITKTKFFQVPSLFYFNSSDTFMYIVLILGLVISVLLISNVLKNKYLRAILFFLNYIFYLSFVTTGEPFMSFQWDALLLEAGFWTIVFVLVSGDETLEKIAKWIFYIMIFKLMFMSGLVKLTSLDKVWANFTALKYHYETQPLPNPLSPYLHFMPLSFHKVSCILMFFVELVLPFFIFMGRKPRTIAGVGFIVLQIAILLTGNYCFFNLLTIILCLPLINYEELNLNKLNILKNSEDILMVNPSISNFLSSSSETNSKAKSLKYLLVILFLVYSFVSFVHILNRTNLNIDWVSKSSNLYLKKLGAFYLNSPYGLFAMMTTERYEIIIQGANDVPGQLAKSEWKSYTFKYKPDKLKKALPIIAPAQPRLDWQMWFAALSSYKNNPWFINFVLKLLEGDKEVLALLKDNPYPVTPPKYIRALMYRYNYADLSSSDMWERELVGIYLPTISLKRSN